VLFLFLTVHISFKMDTFDPTYSDSSDHEINEAQHSSLLAAVSQLDVKQRYVFMWTLLKKGSLIVGVTSQCLRGPHVALYYFCMTLKL
jgi:hypothetical protein